MHGLSRIDRIWILGLLMLVACDPQETPTKRDLLPRTNCTARGLCRIRRGKSVASKWGSGYPPSAIAKTRENVRRD